MYRIFYAIPTQKNIHIISYDSLILEKKDYSSWNSPGNYPRCSRILTVEWWEENNMDDSKDFGVVSMKVSKHDYKSALTECAWDIYWYIFLSQRNRKTPG